MGGSGFTKGIPGSIAATVQGISQPETETAYKNTEEEVNMCNMLL